MRSGEFFFASGLKWPNCLIHPGSEWPICLIYPGLKWPIFYISGVKLPICLIYLGSKWPSCIDESVWRSLQIPKGSKVPRVLNIFYGAALTSKWFK